MASILSRILAAYRQPLEAFGEEELPLRAALFGLEQLENHARVIADSHKTDPRIKPDRLLDRLRKNERIIQNGYEVVAEAVQQKRSLSPAAEWLLDNFYLIEEQFETTRRDFPKGYARQLPQLKTGLRRGFPRVYDIAFQIVSHTDGRLDQENVIGFVRAYQSVTPLMLGELWAVPIMLRLALLENVRRVVHRIVWRRRNRDLANLWAGRFLDSVHRDPKSLILVLADLVRENPPMTRPFITELFTQLQGQHASLGAALNWLEEQLADAGQTVEQLIQAESQDQAADHVSMGNTITSLRFLDSFDWREFVEELSIVEDILRREHAGIYPQMDFRSRDWYRHVVENLARHSKTAESQVASLAVELAHRNSGKSSEKHLGYWLIGSGRLQLEREIRYRVPVGMRCNRSLTRWPMLTYLGLFTLLVLGLTFLVLLVGLGSGLPHLASPWMIPVVLLLLLAASQPAISIVNWLITLILPPRQLPRMDFSKGIPDNCRTIVAVPGMLSCMEEVDNLIHDLEIRYLGNRDPNLLLALLTDFADSLQEHTPDDERLLKAARRGIESLNERYAGDDEPFMLLHRPRKWNHSENKWMGYERKRGKLEALHNLVLHGNAEPFSLVVGDMDQLQSAKYVITLDADTQLPPRTAGQMIGSMAHPLNWPEHHPETRRVVRGYGLMQPRVAMSLLAAGKSIFARMHAAEVGIDPYTRQVSNIYHDLFGEGAFIGKGIYDIRAFATAIGGRFPENAILSHDLLEGSYIRCAFLNDVELIEEQPAVYTVDAMRRHRWVRGDWQIARWLRSRVPNGDGRMERNPLDGFARWQIFDNLRRSLIPPAFVLLLILQWLLLPGSPGLWTAATIGLLLVPWVIRSVRTMAVKPEYAIASAHVRHVLRMQSIESLQELLAIVALPYTAYLNLDAICRVLYRKHVSHQRLLEWQTANDIARRARGRFLDILAKMWFAPFAAIAIAVAIVLLRPHALPAAAWLLLAWFIAPLVAWRISQPIVRRRVRLTADQRLFLGKLARQTWRFFEQFVTADQNWLPPDNYQEHPVERLAERTSPTNIGLLLLANLSASDFGYISRGRLIERTSNTFATLARLKRYRGHFFNWYDTRSATPIHPRYISSVDSCNLSGFLLTLGAGLNQLPDESILPPRWQRGMQETLGLLLDETRRALSSNLDPAVALQVRTFRQAAEPFIEELDRPVEMLRDARALLRQIESTLVSARPFAPELEELDMWIDACLLQARDIREDLLYLAPWLAEEAESAPWRQAISPVGENREEFDKIMHDLASPRTLRELARFTRKLDAGISAGAGNRTADSQPDQANWCTQVQNWLRLSADRAEQRLESLADLAEQSHELRQMDKGFLYDPNRKLMRIGFNLDVHRFDTGYYDLLASESRLGSFLAVAENELPYEHWFMLGRQLAPRDGLPTLVSWSGSMFEYLMPQLVMPTYDNTLLEQTYRGAVRRHIRFGRRRNVPWGISESGYNLLDAHMNYQYRAFGVPQLGLKRGLGQDLVIAPYAAALALMILPRQACDNLREMVNQGFLGRYGLYEAIDYTPSRVPKGQRRAVVQSYMAHHSGMSLLSMAWVLLDRPMQRRFEATPQVQASLLLLQERVPAVFRSAGLTRRYVSVNERAEETEIEHAAARVYTTPDTPNPEVHLLSNGRYHVMVSNAGGGYASFHDIAVTRWREDSSTDKWGQFCFLRDRDSGAVWSAAFQPTRQRPDSYEVVFAQGTAEFRRRDHNIEAYTRICVSPEDNIEVRRVTLTNLSRRPRRVEITTYAEVVLAESRAEHTNPAFNNLFIQTELLQDKSTIICTRRPRSADEKTPWMFHAMMVEEGREDGEPSCETDRARFIGRGRTIAEPHALFSPEPLSNSSGAVLDPSVSIRRYVRIEPGESAVVDIVTGAANLRDEILSLAEKYRDRRLVQRVFEIAWTHSQVLLHHLGATENEAQLFSRLAGSLLYANPSMRARPGMIARNARNQAGLWSYGISGDSPIVLLRITDRTGLPLVRQLVQAHAYWRNKGLRVDLVIWTEAMSGYRQALRDEVVGLIATGAEAGMIDQSGGIHVRSLDQVPEDDRTLFQAVARIILSDRAGSLSDQIERRVRAPLNVPEFPSAQPASQLPPSTEQAKRTDLVFYNGIGGFTGDGREYVINLQPGSATPAPWSNVLANPEFGSVVTESGGGYTWFRNAHEFRLTPWNNDSIQDPPGEAFYLRDEESGRFWSPTPNPVPGGTGYICRHGLGYTVFEHVEDSIYTEMTVFVAVDASVKFALFNIQNRSNRPRRISITGFYEWVLGDSREDSMHVVTRLDPQTGAIFASNAFNTELPQYVGFVQASETDRSITGDRTEFLGRNGSTANPAALHRRGLSNRVGAGIDPCAAILAYVDLPPGQQRQVSFMLGAGENEHEARNLVQRFNGAPAARQALQQVWDHWNHVLGAIYVETPDRAFNFLANHWMLYQTLACRMWGRSGFYQSGGAFGFRDQLQDSLALLHTRADLVREHLLRSAARQFREGDVQHWWHPPAGRGSRTRISDDYLWLPYVACMYVDATGDTGVLDEVVPFLEGRPLAEDEESYYDLPIVSDERDTLYNHCIRAIEYGLKFGPHNLPLMGSGDWNDGMNRVGIHGRGESVWLAFFLIEVLRKFITLAESRNDMAFVQRCRQNADALRDNVNRHGWDGQWYRRAFFDDGQTLGSSESPECQIDSIAQSWSVLSGAGDPEKTPLALQSLQARLVREDLKLIQLLDPPFDKATWDPGYIKGYIPGVRENGGQYTHAAIWAVMAFAHARDAHTSWKLFNLINPIHHGHNPDAVQQYKVEPYVVAADVYTAAGHQGRGGWTWYTGSAGWMYRLLIENFLGLSLRVDRLTFAPLVPPGWNTFRLHYRYRGTFYHIVVNVKGPNTWNVRRLIADGAELPDKQLPLVDDHRDHAVELEVG